MYRYYWHVHRRRVLLAFTLLTVVAVGLVLFFSRSATPPPSIAPQGVAPPDQATPVVAARQPDQLPQAQQTVLLDAVNCARTRQGLAPFTLDATLSATAAQLWYQLQQDVSISLDQLPGEYALRSLIAFDPAQPAQGCTIGGFDATPLAALEGVSTLGIAVFPPQMPGGEDGASALILGR